MTKLITFNMFKEDKDLKLISNFLNSTKICTDAVMDHSIKAAIHKFMRSYDAQNQEEKNLKDFLKNEKTLNNRLDHLLEKDQFIDNDLWMDLYIEKHNDLVNYIYKLLKLNIEDSQSIIDFRYELETLALLIES